MRVCYGVVRSGHEGLQMMIDVYGGIGFVTAYVLVGESEGILDDVECVVKLEGYFD